VVLTVLWVKEGSGGEGEVDVGEAAVGTRRCS
jgi:hypothetical protein